MRKTGNVLARIAEALLVVSFSLVIIIAFLQVVFRYVLGAPLVWSSEASNYLHIASVYLGAALAWMHREHLRLDVMDPYYARMPRKLVGSINLILGACALFVLASAVYGFIEASLSNWVRAVIIMPWLKIGWVLAFAGLCIFFIFLWLTCDLIRLAWSQLRGEKTERPW